jgi:hypothetical protein
MEKIYPRIVKTENRFTILTRKIDRLIEKEISRLPPGIEATPVLSSQLPGTNTVKGKHIGFIFVIDLSTYSVELY